MVEGAVIGMADGVGRAAKESGGARRGVEFGFENELHVVGMFAEHHTPPTQVAVVEFVSGATWVDLVRALEEEVCVEWGDRSAGSQVVEKGLAEEAGAGGMFVVEQPVGEPTNGAVFESEAPPW